MISILNFSVIVVVYSNYIITFVIISNIIQLELPDEC